MRLHNATLMRTGYTMGLQPDGRELLVVVVKGTFSLPGSTHEARLSNEQIPLIEADTFAGEPGLSAPIYETDYAPRKPNAEVLLNGSAYAPGGRATDRVTVRMRVGSVNKSFDVVGNRDWRGGLLGLTASPPEKFTVQPISYAVAFGGTDKTSSDPKLQRTYQLNHVGIGYHENTNVQAVVGQPLPRTEETGKPIGSPKGNYRPMAYGPVGRAWQSRVALAGTYDSHWLDSVSPFLPADFRDEYYQSAPTDQQLKEPLAGAEVELTNLTPNGRLTMIVPAIEVPIQFFLRGGKIEVHKPVLDTLFLEPDLKRFTLTWRLSYPLLRSVFDVRETVVGNMPRGWYRARKLGIMYYPSLDAMPREVWNRSEAVKETP